MLPCICVHFWKIRTPLFSACNSNISSKQNCQTENIFINLQAGTIKSGSKECQVSCQCCNSTFSNTHDTANVSATLNSPHKKDCIERSLDSRTATCAPFLQQCHSPTFSTRSCWTALYCQNLEQAATSRLQRKGCASTFTPCPSGLQVSLANQNMSSYLH